MTVSDAIERAEATLPGSAAPEGAVDPRWQALITIGDFVEDEPDAVWSFVERWGAYPDDDLRAAIATCLTEHLLEHHFDLIFPRLKSLARSDPCFAQMVHLCALFGEAERPDNAARIRNLKTELSTQ